MITVHAARDLRLLIVIALLYVTQGIPLGLAMEALPTILRQDGASLRALALLPLVGLPWILKFVWAPIVDNRWSERLGKRRSWIIPMQAIVLICLVATALIGVGNGTALAAIALFAIASLASATQDTATDGLAVENFGGNMLVRANAVQVGGTMIGFFAGGSGSLILSGMFGRTMGLLGIATIVALGLILIVAWHEPRHDHRRTSRTPASLRRFMKRNGAWHVLAVALLTAMTASATFSLFKLFLVDQGWPLERIGAIGMMGGMATILIGCGGGAWFITRAGLKPIILVSIAFLLTATLLWGLMTTGTIPIDFAAALAAVLAGSIGGGGASVGAMTFAMRFAQRDHQAGTDMTAVQSSRDFGEIGANSLATMIAAGLGFGAAFLSAAGMAMLAGLAVVRSRDVPKAG